MRQFKEHTRQANSFIQHQPYEVINPVKINPVNLTYPKQTTQYLFLVHSCEQL